MEFGEDVTENTLRIRICNLRKAEGLGSPSKVKSGRVAKSILRYPGICVMDTDGRFSLKKEGGEEFQGRRFPESGSLAGVRPRHAKALIEIRDNPS